MTLDRSKISTALAKAIAYKQCGKQDQAEQWARELINLLECADILNPLHGQSPDNVKEINSPSHNSWHGAGGKRN